MSTPKKLANVRVEYALEATINIGNFQNIKPGYVLSADVPEGMHPTEARNYLKSLVEKWLEEDVEEAQRDKSA